MAMKNVMEHRGIQFFLVVAVAIIWGYNTFTLIDISSDRNIAAINYKQDSNGSIPELPKWDLYAYKSDFKDPFRAFVSKPNTNPPPIRHEPSPPEIILPQISLNGVIEGVALIQTSNRELFFAEVGDSIQGVRIKAVYKDSVMLEYKSKNFSLKLQ